VRISCENDCVIMVNRSNTCIYIIFSEYWQLKKWISSTRQMETIFQIEREKKTFNQHFVLVWL
jgi:hypothetical protein